MKGHRLLEFGVQGVIVDTVRRNMPEGFGPGYFQRQLTKTTRVHLWASTPDQREERDHMLRATHIYVTAWGWQRASRAHHRRRRR